jgi:Tol biopolymer transport system component
MNPRPHPIPILLAPLVLTVLPAAAQVAGVVTRASVSSAGVEGNGVSVTNSDTNMSCSADGRYVAFNSAASNLVPGDTNGAPDTFVRDLLLGTTERISVSSSGQQGNPDNYGRGSYGASMSADGRYVAFESYSPNLVANDSGGLCDIFVHDRVTGSTVRASVSTKNKSPNGASHDPSISGDGRYVLFDSAASDLVSGDHNQSVDVFVRDLWTNTTTRVSVSPSGAAGNGASTLFLNGQSLSADGRFAVFKSSASNLVSGDTNGVADLFVRDLWAGSTERVNVTSAGLQTNGAVDCACISGDGNSVAFWSTAGELLPPGAASNGYQGYVRDRTTNTTECLSVSTAGDLVSQALPNGALSADGRFFAFWGNAALLGAGFTGSTLTVRDRYLGMTTGPVLWAGPLTWSGSSMPTVAMAANGAAIAFNSDSPYLVPNDTNGLSDVFVVQ